MSFTVKKSGKFNHVAVVMGGLSSEREVSLSSGKPIIATLEKLGYQVTPIDMDRDIATQLTKLKPDVVFNALHGTYGEDGCLQGLLEILHIPYTHSGVMASAIAMDKGKSITLFTHGGLLCPPGKLYTRAELIKALPDLKRPYVIKPVSEGSSVGVHIILENDKTPKPEDIHPANEFLVEQYIPGKELSVAILGNEPLGVIELEPLHDFYDYEHKYTAGMTNHFMPARIDKTTYQQAMDVAYKAHILLGCKQISRSDFRFDPASGKVYLMEVNTHPGMTPLSLVPEIAEYCGISFETLIQYLLENASCEK